MGEVSWGDIYKMQGAFYAKYVQMPTELNISPSDYYDFVCRTLNFMPASLRRSVDFRMVLNMNVNFIPEGHTPYVAGYRDSIIKIKVDLS